MSKILNTEIIIDSFPSITTTIRNVLESGNASIGSGISSSIEMPEEDTTSKNLSMNNFLNDPFSDKQNSNIYSVLNTLGEEAKETLSNKDAQDIADEIWKYKTETSITTNSKTPLDIESSDQELSGLTDFILNKAFPALDSAQSWIKNTALPTALNAIQSISGSSSSIFTSFFSSILTTIGETVGAYQDGVSETTFGSLMANSWYGNNSKSFVNAFLNKRTSYSINFLDATPMDGSEGGSGLNSIFGTLMLGAPFLFNKTDDIHNREVINTFAKDGRFISITPGMPKYNGGIFSRVGNSPYKQTETPDEMLAYLLKNGLDQDFTNKDKRYYTFESDYESYFSYLETMLNTIWLKLGLGNTENGKEFNLFSFFELTDGKASNYNSLKSNFKSSIGFFYDSTGSSSESISNQRTGFDVGNRANAASEQFQRLNYITGMGTGSGMSNTIKAIGASTLQLSNLTSLASDIFNRTTALWNSDISSVLKVAGTLGTVPIDLATYSTTDDLSAVLQTFSVSNGMRVMYPELWSDSDYSKNISFTLNFTSPYGDPLSIFQYVYVPFCALLAFALPRQAADNGYVSPFFIRADVPGLFTTDLALIADITWTKGGDRHLFTKDGLPRSISCTVSLTDLYPYLAMTKRLSFLSANPSFTVFLDNMAGIRALSESDSDDSLNTYWTEMINRISGSNNKPAFSQLWNRFNSIEKTKNQEFAKSYRESIGKNIKSNSVPWMN